MNRNSFLVLNSQKGNPIPHVVNWYGKLDTRKVNRESYLELPKHLLLDMRIGTDVIYPDILADPILLVSREALEVIHMYVRKMPFLHVALFDIEKGEGVSYYCPILAEGGNCGETLYRLL